LIPTVTPSPAVTACHSERLYTSGMVNWERKYVGLPIGSGRSSLFTAVILLIIGLLLFRLGAGHTVASRRFSQRPECNLFVWITAGEMAAAAATGIAVWPVTRMLIQTTGWRALAQALVAWVVVGVLFLLGPRALPASKLPLWLLYQRITVATVLVGIFVAPSFVGLMLTQKRLFSLRHEMSSVVAKGTADQAIAELLWLRAAMTRFLSTFALVISGAILTAGVLRLALIANGQPSQSLPVLGILAYGGTATALSALIFLPAYVAWQERVMWLREELYPFPQDSMSPPHTWYESRNDYDSILSVQAGAGGIFRTSFAILAPLIGSVLATLLPGPK
jgi:hypothetical protein